MGERTAAEVLTEKIAAIWGEMGMSISTAAIAARLAEDPAITVRTDMVVERFVVEFHYGGTLISPKGLPLHGPESVKAILTSNDWFSDIANHRVIVRPYPEGEQ